MLKLAHLVLCVIACFVVFSTMLDLCTTLSREYISLLHKTPPNINSFSRFPWVEGTCFLYVHLLEVLRRIHKTKTLQQFLEFMPLE
jgi:hypothetical protein